ncbi:MAG: hypothetical protein DRJ47_06240 [Thermoprotei archaeon]|nr:MAG: hypothetical protein DRJ47_06240 [Thermoprotei archaeon]
MAGELKTKQIKKQIKLKKYEKTEIQPDIKDLEVYQDGADLVVIPHTDYPVRIFIDRVFIGKASGEIRVNLEKNPHLRLLMETEKQVEVVAE